MQRSSQQYYLQRMVYYGSRLICDHSGWQGTKFPSNAFEDANKAKGLQTQTTGRRTDHPKQWDYKCNSVSISIFSGHETSESQKNYTTNGSCGFLHTGASNIQEDPALQYCYISLLGYRALNTFTEEPQTVLSKYIWCFANLGLKAENKSVPQWATEDSNLSVFLEKLKFQNLSVEQRRAYEEEKMAEGTFYDAINVAKAKGREEGREEAVNTIKEQLQKMGINTDDLDLALA